jgi:carbonic anhydrase
MHIGSEYMKKEIYAVELKEKVNLGYSKCKFEIINGGKTIKVYFFYPDSNCLWVTEYFNFERMVYEGLKKKRGNEI